MLIDNTVLKLTQSFPRSFINQHGEFIAHEKANEYFKLASCIDECEVKCKILEWFSRGACKTEPYRQSKKNEDFQNFMLNGINNYLGTNFSRDEMRVIYQCLGNQVNRKLTNLFISNDYDMRILEQEDAD